MTNPVNETGTTSNSTGPHLRFEGAPSSESGVSIDMGGMNEMSPETARRVVLAMQRRIGASPHYSGAHLHFELSEGGVL